MTPVPVGKPRRDGLTYLTNRQKKVRIPRSRLAAFAKSIMRKEGLKGDLSVVFVGDREISEINRRFLRHKGPTDVISFPLNDPHDSLAGEVVISAETAKRESAARGIPLRRELALYLAHGILHLCGHGDRAAAQARKMRRMEAYYMNMF
jgi:probable rRNA maturation factor